LEAENSLVLLYLGQYFLQIPYFLFELLDHFPSHVNFTAEEYVDRRVPRLRPENIQMPF
jgi:hypothetical protein